MVYRVRLGVLVHAVVSKGERNGQIQLTIVRLLVLVPALKTREIKAFTNSEEMQ